MTEHTYRTEKVAHEARRAMILKGVKVSLVAFDTSRNVYVFDSYEVR